MDESGRVCNVCLCVRAGSFSVAVGPISEVTVVNVNAECCHNNN